MSDISSVLQTGEKYFHSAGGKDSVAEVWTRIVNRNCVAVASDNCRDTASCLRLGQVL